MKDATISAAFSHELMVTVVEALYPDLVCGADYMVGHPVDPVTGQQVGDPSFSYWKAAAPQPEVADLKAEFTANEATHRATFIRKYRNACLQHSDMKTWVPPDMPAAVRASQDEWLTYRQALRDVPQQAGFPFDVDWPEYPG